MGQLQECGKSIRKININGEFRERGVCTHEFSCFSWMRQRIDKSRELRPRKRTMASEIIRA
jgi:hypothetical protein